MTYFNGTCYAYKLLSSMICSILDEKGIKNRGIEAVLHNIYLPIHIISSS